MATKRGRTSGFVMSAEHRTKIANSQILKCLLEHAVGKRDMTATQVTVGIALLKKVMPDLSAVELSGSVDLRRANDVTDDELAHIAAGSSEGAVEAPIDPTQLN